MLHTPLCDLLGIAYPILSAPMGPDISGPELVAAVSNAGGLGLLQAQLCPPPMLREELRRLRRMSDRRFGVNFILRFPSEEAIEVCLEERVPVLSFSWGDPAPYLRRAHAAGAKVLLQVGSVEAARAARRGPASTRSSPRGRRPAGTSRVRSRPWCWSRWSSTPWRRRR